VQAFGADAQEAGVNRSYLFVPADSERKLANARSTAADALILDLEDSVPAASRPAARKRAHDYLKDGAVCELWIRINPLDGADAQLDLAAVMPARPAGIVLPKPVAASDVVKLGQMLDVLECDHGIPSGQTLIMPIATERPDALFRLHEYAGCSNRLAALSWGAEDLSAAIGASENRSADGHWLPTYELARSLCLLAAAAAGVAAVDTVYTNFRDDAGLARYAATARRDGFSGMLAIHPSQVATINTAFSPSPEELQRARNIVALFAQSPDAGTLGMDGEMVDRPHLLQARRIIALAEQQHPDAERAGADTRQTGQVDE
jgi:citrate lyase subunit beta/citryl-CoA lyase